MTPNPIVNIEPEQPDVRIEINVTNEGKDGHTPVKGVDYWTDADRQEIIDEVKTQIDVSGAGTVKSVNGNLPDKNGNVIVLPELPSPDDIPIADGDLLPFDKVLGVGTDFDSDELSPRWELVVPPGTEAVRFTKQTLNVNQQVQARENIGAQPKGEYASKADVDKLSEEIAFKPDAYPVENFYLWGDTTGMTKDDAVVLRFAYKEYAGWAKVKWQGSSSLKWPKKNYTISLYYDEACTQPMAIEIVEGWGAHHKYCFKANFIDFSHARNVCSGKLWGKVVKSRSNVSDELSTLPNGGAIDGFPCIIMLNGKFHGLYTWNIPKDGWMYGMDNGDVQTETESLPFDTYAVNSNDDFDGTPEPTTKKTDCCIFTRSTLSGGRLRVNWDVNKLNGFDVRVYLFNEADVLTKIFCGSNGTITNPNYGAVSGDLDMAAWLDVGTQADKLIVSGPFTLPIPEGYTARLELTLIRAHYTMPDGTLTSSWSTEAEANNTWVNVWIRTGIEVSAEVHTYSSYEHGAIFGADTTSEATKFKTTATLTDDFDLEYVTDENNADWALTSLNQLITACMNSDGTDLDTTIEQYLDWDSAIDYYIYTCLIGGADMAGKNYLLYTFDGTKWAFGAYDMDSTFGLWWDGTKFLRETNYPTIKWYADYHKVMNLIRYYKKDAFKVRYAELRAGALSEGSIAETFTNFIAKIPAPVYTADANKWPTIPSTAANNLNQILNWYRMRCEVIDAEVEAMT